MKALTFRWSAADLADVSGTLRVAAACPVPELHGLRSRHFRAESDQLIGRYYFDDAGPLEAFAQDPAVDPAALSIARRAAPASVTVEDITSLDVFDRPLFLVAAPCAGRTLLYELLVRSTDVWTTGGATQGLVEGIRGLHPASRDWDSHELTDVHADPVTVQSLQAVFVDELRDRRQRRFLELVESERRSRIRLIDRMSENSLRIQFLAAAFPDARFVFVHRDARQNVSSLLEAWRDDAFVSIPSLPGWHRGAWHGLLPQRWRDYCNAPLVDVAAFQWAAANQRALDDLEWLAPGRWMAVDYAELIASPGTVLRRVLALAGLEMDEACESAFEAPGPFERLTPSSPIKWRSNPEFRESALTPHNVLRGRLRELGGPSAPPPSRHPTDATIRFACRLDQLDIDPAPFHDAWIVHPSFHFQLGATVPIGLVRRTRFRDRFLPDFPLVWVEDDATNGLYPFWARREDAHVLSRFAAGQPAPRIRHELGAQLVAARVLATREEIAKRRAQGNALVDRASARFDARRYCLLSSLVHPAHVAALGHYYDTLIAAGDWTMGDSQVRHRYGWHNESVARYLHHQLSQVVGRIVGAPVRPSYCYVSAYRGSTVSLRPHVDRKQCVFTLSLWIGGAATANTEPWPLWLHCPDGIVSVTQSSGDAVLFCGCELPHWRDQAPPGGASTTLIFHYVPREFAGVLD